MCTVQIDGRSAARIARESEPKAMLEWLQSTAKSVLLGALPLIRKSGFLKLKKSIKKALISMGAFCVRNLIAVRTPHKNHVVIWKSQIWMPYKREKMPYAAKILSNLLNVRVNLDIIAKKKCRMR